MTAAELGGVPASTAVIEKIYLPHKTKQAQIFEGDAKSSAAEAGRETEVRGAGDMSVLVVLEQQGGKWHRMSWETLAAGAAVRRVVGTCRWKPPSSDTGVGALAAEAATKKVAKVYAVEHELLKDYTADAYTAAVEALIRKVNPKLVLFPHTYQVRDFAPKLATRFDQVLISDVIAVRLRIRLAGVRASAVSRQTQWRRARERRGTLLRLAASRRVASGFARIRLGVRSRSFTPPLDSAQIRQKPERRSANPREPWI